MDREHIEAYEARKREMNLLSESDDGLDERIEGLDAIRAVINPHMSRSAFYRRHRQALDYILLVDVDHWRTGRPKYFTFRRLIYHYMLKQRKI
jgi:hypothetical protein